MTLLEQAKAGIITDDIRMGAIRNAYAAKVGTMDEAR